VADEGGKGLIYTWEDRGLWQRFVAEFPESPALLAGIKKLFIWAVERVSKGRLAQSGHSHRQFGRFLTATSIKETRKQPECRSKKPVSFNSGIDANFFAFERVKEFGSPLTIWCPAELKSKKDSWTPCAGSPSQNKRHPFEMVIIGEPWNKVLHRTGGNRDTRCQP
jgi:hypothetical protein